MLTLVIPTFNGEKLLRNSLPSIFCSLEKIKKWELIIVDNNSTDKTKQYLQKLNMVKYIRLRKNYGFSGSINKVIKEAKGNKILIINNDCIIDKNAIEEMIQFLDTHKEYVATQPIIYKFKDQSEKSKVDKTQEEIENIGYVVDLWKGKTEVIKNWKLEIGNLMYNYVQNNIFKQRYLYGLSATCLLIRKDVFVKNGMFDESFHSYLEDVDLFIRLAKQGYRYYPTLTAMCYHMHMATSKRMGLYKERQDLKNWVRIIIKNYPLELILRHFPALFIERLKNLNGLIKKSMNLLQLSCYGR